MMTQTISLYNWTNGVIMIAIFGIVCITLVGIIIKFMMSDKKKDNPKN